MASIRFLVPKNYTSDQKGKFFEDEIASILRKMGYKVTNRIRFTGMEIDLLADHEYTHDKVRQVPTFLDSYFQFI